MVFLKLRLPLLVGVCALVTLLPACKPVKAPADIQADSGEKHYPLTGQILKVDAAGKGLLVQHEKIPGLMPAMTMEFTVSDGDLANAKEGQRIRADLIIDAKGDARLEKIWPADPVADSTVEAAAGALRQDTAIRGKSAYREVGETVPDFALYDQDGKVVTAARFRGKQIMLNFIYSRCPVATMCPAATANMMTTQRKAKEAGVNNIEFISITLDPENDTPGVLKEYARVRGIDTGNFSFLTGPEGAIKDLLTQFGILADFDGGIVKHTLSTLLINEQGKIIWRADGSQWSPDEFVQKMHKAGS
ncbi:MAG TPA: SCO family protein [Rariglobus sp.]|jgi:protein SCO1/2|nr:SCO family protein [Rariglobus sp.]